MCRPTGEPLTIKGPLDRQPQVFAGELVVGAIFCNTEIRVLGKSNFNALHRRI